MSAIPTCNPYCETPKGITEELTSFGGKNPYGLPLWRLVAAERHTVIRGGTWTDVAADDNPFIWGPNGDRIALPPTVQRARSGIMEVPLYPTKGLILEHWFPASKFGTREAWEAGTDKDTGLHIMGPYPSEGGYWMMRGPWDRVPPIAYMKDLIGRYEHFMDEMYDVDPMVAMQQFLDEQKKVEEAEFDHFTEERAYAMRHIVLPMMRSTSLSAQRERQRIMNACGIRSHVAVGGDS